MTIPDFEHRELDRKTLAVWTRCQNTVQHVLGRHHTIQFLTLNDRRRLLTLLVWEERYKVSVEWILTALLQIFCKSRKSRRVVRKPGLPVTVKTLVSRSTEELLKMEIEKELPEEANCDLWRQSEQERILEKMYLLEHSGELEEGTSSLVRFKTLKGYKNYYTVRVLEKREWMEKMRRRLHKKSRPYRNNPFH